MKKLMFAAALCATVGLAHGSIESSNIVGYQTPGVKENVGIAINTFNPVTGDVVDLQSIKVTAEGVLDGQIQLQTLTPGGATARTLYWIPEEMAADYDMEGEGWYDVDEFAPAELNLEIGEGIVTVNDYGEGATITFAGAVPMGATEVAIGPNVTVAGNSTPVAVDIQSIVVTAEGILDGQIQIQTLTPGGATARTLYWIPEEMAADYDMEGEGWYDVDEFAQAEWTVAAGEGFVLVNDYGEGAVLKVPSPLN